MERRKPRGSIFDELAATKAAAWAWYQRGSGSETKPTREYDHLTARTHRGGHLQPSRYKLEALQKSQLLQFQLLQATEESSDSSSISLSPTRAGAGADDHSSHLLDTYEIERISRQLDYYMEETGSRFPGSDRRRVASVPERETVGAVKISKKEINSRRSKKKGSFWLSHGVTCGSRDDVVEFARVFRDRRPSPKKNVGAVGVDNRRPRATRV